MPDQTATVVIRINRKSNGPCYGEITSANDGAMHQFHNIQEMLCAINESLNSPEANLALL